MNGHKTFRKRHKPLPSVAYTIQFTSCLQGVEADVSSKAQLNCLNTPVQKNKIEMSKLSDSKKQ